MSKKILTIVIALLLVIVVTVAAVLFLFPYEPTIKKSISEVKQLCIINNGNEFNNQCKDMLIAIENLYLYPGKFGYQEFYDFYLYNSDKYPVYSDTMESNFLTQEENYINICIEEKSNLYHKVKNKVDDLEKPIAVDILGRVNSAELCTEFPGGCDTVLFIVLDDITYKETKILENCLEWFDGCNTCLRENGHTVCTERYCEPDEYEASECFKYVE
jgi:hypothetical protein